MKEPASISTLTDLAWRFFLTTRPLMKEGRFTISQFSADLVAFATRASLDPSSTQEKVGAGIVRAPQS